MVTAPEHAKIPVTKAVDHTTREAHRRCTARPKSIKRLRVDMAEKVIDVIDDPRLLAEILHMDKRRAVEQAVKNHRLWNHIPHELLCSQCSTLHDQASLVKNLEDFTTLVGEAGATCSVLLLKALDRLGHEDAVNGWRILQGRTGSHGLTAVQVAVAAGRANYVQPEDARGRGYAGSDLARLLNAEEKVTVGLLALAVDAQLPLPASWSPTEEHWQELLRRNARALLRNPHGPGAAFVQRNWDLIAERERCWALETAKSAEDVTMLVDMLMSTPITLNDSGPLYSALLQRHKDIVAERRVYIVMLSGRGFVTDCLTGKRGIALTCEEIRLLVEKLVDLNEVALLKNVARLYNIQVEKVATPEQAVLLEELIDRLPAARVFESRGVLAREAHRRIWERLDPGIHAEILGGLVADWGGTVDELIEAAATI